MAKLDVFISNAGIGPISRLEDLRVEDWEAMVDVNIKDCCTVSQPRCPYSVGRACHFVKYHFNRWHPDKPYDGRLCRHQKRGPHFKRGLRIESKGRYRVTGISPGLWVPILLNR